MCRNENARLKSVLADFKLKDQTKMAKSEFEEIGKIRTKLKLLNEKENEVRMLNLEMSRRIHIRKALIHLKLVSLPNLIQTDTPRYLNRYLAMQ